MSKLNDALAALEKAQNELARVTGLMRRFPEEPPIGTVLRFTKPYRVRRPWNPYAAYDEAEVSYEVRSYSYVAFRAPNGVWYTTGKDAQRGASWEQVVEQISDNPCEQAAQWTDVPRQGEEASE